MGKMTELKFDQNGLIPAIVQNYKTGKVLMLGYMNRESFAKTLESGTVWFYSRSRKELWNKGETSGNFLQVMEITSDCDDDAILIKADPKGPTCHTGAESCFHHEIENGDKDTFFDSTILFDLFEVIEDRKANPVEGSYTNYLFEKGIDKILKKVGEESAETIIAAKNDSKEEITYETSDLFYHLLVMMSDRGVKPENILKALYDRHGGKY